MVTLAVRTKNRNYGVRTRSKKSKGFRWNAKKREAVQLLVKGYPVREIGEKIDAHFTSVQRWKGEVEFQTAVVTRVREKMMTTRFRRVYTTGVITDMLAKWAMKLLKRMDREKLSRLEFNKLKVFLAEYRAYREVEAADFGIRKGESFVNINVNMMPKVDSAVSERLAAMLEEHSSKLPQRLIQAPSRT